MRRASADKFITATSASLLPAHTVLDIGPGIRPQTLVECRVHICVEPFDEYVEILTREHPELVVLNCTWTEAVDLLGEGSVDTVVLMDVIEHLDKEEGRRLLDATVRIARSQVVIQTPLGFMEQGADEERDAWGLGGVDWQVHRCGWEPDEFPGWDIVTCEEFHTHDAYGRALDAPHGAFFAVLTKGAGLEPGATVRFRRRAGIVRTRIREALAPVKSGVKRILGR